jgi:acetyl-CoA carboxylase carboxyl transferase subunit alpha
VISPEGCANIIWKTSEKAPEAAAAMGLTSDSLIKLGIVDASIDEPLGGAHRDMDVMAGRIKDHLVENLARLEKMSQQELLTRRYDRLMSYGND